MSDLAEKVKRLRKLTEARAAYLAVSNPDDVNDVLDALALLERERGQIDTLHAAIAHGDDDHRQWLADAIKAHFAYEPVPTVYGRGKLEARCEAAETRITSLEAALAAITTERRTPGTVEVCRFPVLDGGGDCESAYCDAKKHQWASCPYVRCPIKEAKRAAQHPTPSQGTTP